jgi:uncharacterized protein YkvS
VVRAAEEILVKPTRPEKYSQHALNQRSPAEGKGKGQKLLAQGNTLGKIIAFKNALHALKGQKLLAQGNTLGKIIAFKNAL